jgi:hypothetical protein
VRQQKHFVLLHLGDLGSHEQHVCLKTPLINFLDFLIKICTNILEYSYAMETWSPQQSQNHPYQQNWRGTTYGNPPPYHSQQTISTSISATTICTTINTQQQFFPQQQQYQSFPQYPSTMQQTFPSLPSQPQLTQPQPLQLPSNQQPPRPTQIPAQPVENPNNQKDKVVYNVEVDTFPTYLIALVRLQKLPQVQLQEFLVQLQGN